MMIDILTPLKFNKVFFTGDALRQRIYYYSRYDSFERDCDIEKKIFNYCSRSSGKRIQPYCGPSYKIAGFSTEDEIHGGGWLVADTDTPLSTTGVRTCAVLNLVDEDNGFHALYHVYDKTNK